MPTRNGGDGLPPQPDLEAVPPGHWDSERRRWGGMEAIPPANGIEIDPRRLPVFHQGIPWEGGSGPESKQPSPPPPPPKGRRLIWFIAGAVLVVVVILAAVLGGVLGSRGTKHSGASTNGEDGKGGRGDATTSAAASPSPTSTTSATAPPAPTSTAVLQSIRQGSSLSVTGFIAPTDSEELLLFYQGPDNAFRHSQYDFASSAWGSPSTFDLSLNAGTKLAAASILSGGRSNTQIELLYPGSESLVRGWNYVNTTDTPGPDSINQFNESCMPDSSIAFYWPWAVYQNITGELVQAYFNSGWKFTGHLVFALHHTKLALVPLSTSYAKIQSPGGYAIIYQSETGTLGTIIPPTNNLGLPDNYNASWPQLPPAVTFPLKNALAAFTLARPSNSQDLVNTYILYVDESADINVLFTDGSLRQWNATKPAVLQNVDPDTDIACLTKATALQNGAHHSEDLQESLSNARYYFQRGGLVRHVTLNNDGSDWVDEGVVPIP